MSAASTHHATLVALEHELVTGCYTSNRERVEELLHNEFYEHGASGRTWTRSTVLEALPDVPHIDGTCVDFASRDLAPGVALLTYRIVGARPSTRSSLWVNDGRRWQMLFHQGTLSRETSATGSALGSEPAEQAAPQGSGRGRQQGQADRGRQRR